ncbi:hypothetical protein OH76DRAFT_1488012 [Lentinus brumalis]|uniref:Uncharacterized protein n=1 Tax=Lentinus brumalis TaxID=2498619 RepID=A0A371CSJ7_9APHY|nr:hypothetical protein OH76DRAFT_1488012 [Polyporus brumalis]
MGSAWGRCVVLTSLSIPQILPSPSRLYRCLLDVAARATARPPPLQVIELKTSPVIEMRGDGKGTWTRTQLEVADSKPIEQVHPHNLPAAAKDPDHVAIALENLVKQSEEHDQHACPDALAC